MGTSVEDSSLDILKSQNFCIVEDLLNLQFIRPTNPKTYNAIQTALHLLILVILISCTCGRPRLETGNTNVEILIEKEPLTACEEAIYSCCSSPKSTFLQSARCFELNGCPGINFIENPCLFLSSVLNRI